MELLRRLLGDRDSELMYMLNFLDHLLRDLAAKTTVRILAPCGASASSTRRKSGRINVYVGIFRPFANGGLTRKRPSEFQFHVDLLRRLLGGREAKLMYMLEFLDHLLRGFTAKTTL